MYDYQIIHVMIVADILSYEFALWHYEIEVDSYSIHMTFFKGSTSGNPHVKRSAFGSWAAWAFRSGPMAVSKANDSLIWNGPAKVGPKTSYAWGEKAPNK